MNSTLFLLPVFYSEFLIWYKRNSLRVMQFRLIPAPGESTTGEIAVDETLSARVAEAIPEYEDDYEVLLGAVELPEPLHPLLMWQNVVPTYMDISFKQLKCVYPITERGKRLLETRIDTANIKLREALFENAIAKVEDERECKLGIEGAKALLEIANLSSFLTEIESLQPALLSGRLSRLSSKEFPLEGASFPINLLCYDRHDPYPNSDVGYFYDFAKIVSEFWKNEPPVKKLLNDLVKTVKEIGNPQQASLWELVGETSEKLQEVEKFTQIEYPAISCLIFLKLHDEIIKSKTLEKTIFLALVDNLQQLEYKKELAIGLMMTGICCGFDSFCSEYYKLEPF